MGGQDGCERRIEVIVKMPQKSRGGGVRSGRGWRGRGVGVGRGGRGLIGSNVGGRGDLGYGGWEPRKEGTVQCTKRYCTILRKIKNVWGRGNI